MVIGYMRVSTDEQNMDRQITHLSECEKIFAEKISGSTMDRPELTKMLNFIREGDTVVVESYSRLSRSTKDLLDTVQLFKEKGVTFISKKEQIDTSTAMGQFMFTVFAGLVQFERDINRERQKEGIIEAQKKGKYSGRKPIGVDSVSFSINYDLWKSGVISARMFMNTFGLKPNTFYRLVKKHEKSIDKA